MSRGSIYINDNTRVYLRNILIRGSWSAKGGAIEIASDNFINAYNLTIVNSSADSSGVMVF